jgi:hypothetical protein
VAATVLIAGGLGAFGLAAAAFATTPTLVATPSTGIATAGQSIMLTGSGYTASSTGNFLECNNALNEPTVMLPSPVSSAVSVGCTAPSFAANSLTSTSATGTLSKAYMVTGGTVGPPCGSASGNIITTCPATDSTGGNPATDAAKYPCPPTPAQQAAGDTCSINFGDQANDSSTANISFVGQMTVATTTTTTPVVAATTTTAPATTATTAAPTTQTTAPATTSLAQTGPGPALWWLLLVGVVLMSIGSLTWLSTLRILGRRTLVRSHSPPDA